MTRPVMELGRLLSPWLKAGPAGATRIRELCLDHREAAPGTLFVALRGERRHGLEFAPAAVAAGAAVVLYDPDGAAGLALPDGVPCLALPRLRDALGEIAARFFGEPARGLCLIGVTGTNGKTSTVQLVAAALTALGERCGTLGTLGGGLWPQLVPGERTTPDAIGVQRFLARMRAAGAKYVAMEVSSHALEQGRVNGVPFEIAVFTNLTRDHLDYHGSMEAYGAAKARLFDWPTLRVAVLNLDDGFGRELLAGLHPEIEALGYAADPLQRALLPEVDELLLADQVRTSLAGLRFDLLSILPVRPQAGDEPELDESLDHEERRAALRAFDQQPVYEDLRVHPVEARLYGRFNVHNLLAVAGVLAALDVAEDQVAELLGQLAPVPGRMNPVSAPEQPLVVVDYAHTPDALEQTLKSLRAHTRGRLTCVFGCGGERDRGKRPQMGAIASQLADQLVVTDDNPRGEDGELIVAEILAGCDPARTTVLRDRGAAIAQAIAAAQPGDTVLVAGKGHEPYQEIAGIKHPFDDSAVARAALSGWAA